MTHNCNCSLADAFRDQLINTCCILIGTLVIIFVVIIPVLSWIKDKIVASWKTLVWASIGVGMLAVAMTATELQERVISLINKWLLSDNRSEFTNNITTLLKKFI